MRRSLFLTVLLLTCGALVATACSSDDGDSASSSDEGGSNSDSGDSGSGSDSGDPQTDLNESVDSLVDDARETATSLLDEANGAIAGVSDCVEISLVFGQLQAATLGGSDGASQAQEAADELKTLVPSDLDDDIDVIAEAVGSLAEDGLTSGNTALSTPEYEAAINELTDHIESECGSP